MPDLSPAELSALRAAVDVIRSRFPQSLCIGAVTTIVQHMPALLALAEAATQHRCPAAWDKPNSDPIVSAEAQPLWVEYRERWLKRGYDIHAYHGFKAGPLPGCNAGYGDTQCNASIDEHCHCGSGEHLALDSEQNEAPAVAAPGADGRG